VKAIGAQLETHYESDIKTATIPDLVVKRYDNVRTIVIEILNSVNDSGMTYAFIIGNTEA
jgi:hypothetical protein